VNPLVDVEDSLATFDRREHIQRVDGVKVLKLRTDLDRYAHAIAETKPDVLVETGSRFGGSALWFAQHGVPVISVDLDERNRPAHPDITWIRGDSADPHIAERITELVAGRRCMVSLDSLHTAPHVQAEIGLYGPLVSPGCHLVVEDTIFGWAEPGQLRKLTLAPLIDFGTPLDAVEQTVAHDPSWVRDEDIEKMHPTSHHPIGWWRRV
jgi:cephalosporin hydroxylase